MGRFDLTGGAVLEGTTSGGTLAGVTLDGTLDMAENDDVAVDVSGGLTLDGSILLGSIYGAFGESLSFIGARRWAAAAQSPSAARLPSTRPASAATRVP